MLTDLFRTTTANLIENTVYEECGEQVQIVGQPIWLLNDTAHCDYLQAGTEASVEVACIGSERMAIELAKGIVERVRRK